MPAGGVTWAQQAAALLAAFAGPARDWRDADAETIRGAVRGVSPYSGHVKKDGAARVVFNISSEHVPGFVRGAYQNRYDVWARLGSGPPTSAPDARQKVDEALAWVLGDPRRWQGLYYGAVELNGAGIRYYGDVCLVLKDGSVAPDTLVLDRNSFDLICQPLRARTCIDPGGVWNDKAGQAEADAVSGRWQADLADMTVCKVLKSHLADTRRITVGTISEGLLADEDYLEVIRDGSFRAADVQEARLGASDAAADGLAGDRLRRGPTPNWTELLWRHRRRRADRALRGAGIRTRVVVSSGRVRT
jgi:hypothetical protein